MKWLAPAKINLSLRVLGRREDGFHEIETLMVPISLADELTIEPAGTSADALAGTVPIELVCSDPTLPTDDRNLAFRAAAMFIGRIGDPGHPVRLTLQKNIPHGAGLGGGSSDAATTLLALDAYCGTRLETTELAGMAAELGSDVPFFVYRAAAMCRGRGERVESVAIAQALPLLLLKPSFPVPTPLAYQRWNGSRELPGVRYEAQKFSWGELVNDLERPVFEKFLLLAEVKMWLLAQPEVAGALMSGSGSTCFAVLSSEDAGQTLADRARTEFGEIWTCACSTVV